MPPHPSASDERHRATERVKQIAGRVLTRNGITSQSAAQVTLCGGDQAAADLITAKRFGPKSQPSKVRAADQLFDRAAQLSGHVLEDLPQGADPQRLVGRNGEVLVLAVNS